MEPQIRKKKISIGPFFKNKKRFHLKLEPEENKLEGRSFYYKNCYYGKEDHTKPTARGSGLADRTWVVAIRGDNMEEGMGVLVDSVRSISLEIVLERLGAERDKKDKHNWRTPVGRMTVTGPKFFNHDEGIGGGGAIDLVMHILRVDFREAVRVLGGVPEIPRQLPTVLPSGTPGSRSLVPFPVQENWIPVRNYLTRVRKVSGPLVDSLHREGILYSDRYRNAVFLSETGKGAELRGTGPVSFHGYRGEKAPFRLSGVGTDLFFVESAIDAMSLRDLGFTGTILSFGGCAKGLIQNYGREAREKGLKVLAGFDKDRAGESFFEALKEVIPDAGRILPQGKDWNEELLKIA